MSAAYDGAVRGTDSAHHVAPLKREGRLAGQGRKRKVFKRGEKGRKGEEDSDWVQEEHEGGGETLDVRA